MGGFFEVLLCLRRFCLLIIEDMANALESDSTEVQGTIEAKQNLVRLKAEEARKIQALKMTRARIREQLSRTSNERYTVLLNTELQQIESDLEKLA